MRCGDRAPGHKTPLVRRAGIGLRRTRVTLCGAGVGLCRTRIGFRRAWARFRRARIGLCNVMPVMMHRLFGRARTCRFRTARACSRGRRIGACSHGRRICCDQTSDCDGCTQSQHGFAKVLHLKAPSKFEFIYGSYLPYFLAYRPPYSYIRGAMQESYGRHDRLPVFGRCGFRTRHLPSPSSGFGDGRNDGAQLL